MISFDTASRRVLSEFLQTAVVIDDAAYGAGKVEKQVTKVEMPGRGPRKTDSIAEPPARTQSAHSLNTQLLVETFANEGLVCAVIAPQKRETIAEHLGRMVERCDIVIIDWQMFDDNGMRTRALIEDLCKRDSGDRLRLVCVYSGEKDLKQIFNSINEEIDGLSHQDKRKLLLRKDHLIVTVLGKQDVPEDKIVKTLLKRFSKFTKGLLSNAVLAALAGLRHNVHRIVKKFDSELDPAYISHRIMSNPVDTVESEILSIIASELESIVHQSSASDYVDSNAIKRFVHNLGDNKIKYKMLACEEEEAPGFLKQLIEEGYDGKREDISDAFKKVCKGIMKKEFIKGSGLTALLGSDDAKSADRRFAVLSTLETRYGDIAPRLTLGTIIGDDDQYYLCLMPRCDSVRVPKEGRDFLFIRLTRDPTKVDLIVWDNGELVDLGVSKHPYHTVVSQFIPKPGDNLVRARKNRGKWLFARKKQDGSVGTVRWVADMKPQVAQAFANAYASQVSRVGVAKSQWLHQLGR